MLLVWFILDWAFKLLLRISPRSMHYPIQIEYHNQYKWGY